MAAPVFNLSQDLQNFGGKISKMLPANAPNLHVTKISIENIANVPIETLPLKKMVIEINAQCDIFPIIEGTPIYVNRVEKKVKMQCDALVVQNLLPLLNRIGQTQENFIAEGESCYWFIMNWLDKGYVPKWITYENLENIPPLLDNPQTLINATQAIGKSGRTEAGFMVKVSVEYQRSTDTAILGMHPSELLSLLFWQRDGDPCFGSAIENPPIEDTETLSRIYAHPLLSKLMLFNARGERANFDDRYWLGLRPPLRTSIRLEWEVRQTHLFHHANWQNDGSLAGITQNPHVHRSLEGSSKCNIFTGEMSFRSGFRPFGRGGSYLTRTVLMNLLIKENTTNELDDSNRNIFIDRRLVGKHWFIPGSENSQVTRLINHLILHGVGFAYARRTYCKPQPVARRGPDCVNPENRDADYTRICSLKRTATGYHEHRNERTLILPDNSRVIYTFLGNNHLQIEGEAINNVHVLLNKIYSDGLDSLTEEEERDISVSAPIQHCNNTAVLFQGASKLAEDSSCHTCQGFHVFPFKNITRVTDTAFSAGRFDQHCSIADGIPTTASNPVYADSLSENDRVVVELIAGGDPLEPWGVRDLTGSNPH